MYHNKLISSIFFQKIYGFFVKSQTFSYFEPNVIDIDVAMCYNLVTLRAEQGYLRCPKTGDNVYDSIY